MKTAERKIFRCAIYTRKSTEPNLDHEFNSLDAQREACEAYIKSQAHEGWRLIPDHYDDGGLSGASLDRPALQSLLADLRTGRINIVAVYKVDLEYTAAARTEGIEGRIKLKLTIAADGSVSDVEVLASVEPALDAAAVAAARQWRFKPAMACGKPVAGGTFIMTKTYELTD